MISMGNEWDTSFDVEITSKVVETKELTIDVAPVFPVCKGGHVFMLKTKN